MTGIQRNDRMDEMPRARNIYQERDINKFDVKFILHNDNKDIINNSRS